MLPFVTIPKKPLGLFHLNCVLLLACGMFSLAGSLVGCREDDSLEPKLLSSAELPAAIDSENAELAQLAKAMQTSGTLPRQLDPPSTDETSNAAVLLKASLPNAEKVTLGKRLPWVTLRESMPFDGDTLLVTASVLEKKPELTDQISVASDQPRCAYQVMHIYGAFGPNYYLDDTQIAVRLLMARSYDAALAGENERAIKDLERAFQWTHWLSRVKKPIARVHAATLRSEVFGLVSELMNNGRFHRREAELIYGMLRDQLANWPSDRRMLEGDRAASAHSYEAIRLGLANKILTFEEQRSLERQGELKAFTEASPTALDQDEINYLRAMQLLIEAATAGPFCQRIEAIEKAHQQASMAPNLYADRIFLVDLTDAQRAAAKDRTRCEAWSLALAAAANQTMPNFHIAPINGREYQAEIDASRITIVVGNPSIIDPSCPRL